MQTTVMPCKALQVLDLRAGYPGHAVLEGVTFQLPMGSLTGVIGPNGAGKSTLLKAILGLLDGVSGQVTILEASLQLRRKRVAYVPQRSSIDWDFPANVFDVVLMGRYAHKPWWSRPGRVDRRVVNEVLERVGLADLAQRRISDLSGGQQQRTFLARALAQEAALYLLDEPLAGVDAASERVIMRELAAVRAQGGAAVMVHHDLNTAATYFDHVLLLNRRVCAYGPTEAVFLPHLLAETYGGSLFVLNPEKASAGVLD